MKVKFKKLHQDAVIPKYAKPLDGAMDLVATSKEYNKETNNLTFGTGLAVEIPEGHLGFILPRSSICNTQLTLSNSLGLIDAGYRGEIKAVFRVGHLPLPLLQQSYEVGDRICQLVIMPFPIIEPIEVQELSSTERGEGGFGHTGI